MALTNEQKEEERRQQEKEAVASMRGAVKNMQAVLNRNVELESALKRAADSFQHLKRYAPENAYNYGGKKRVTELFDEAESECRKLL